jgi:hypothetical protein
MRAWPIVMVLWIAGCGRLGFATHRSDAATDADAGAAGGPYRGARLLLETFEDEEYDARGWYDGAGGAAGPPAPATGGTRSFQCTFSGGAQECLEGDPGRHAFAAAESIYVSYWVRYEPGSSASRAVWLFTTADDQYVAGAESRLGPTFGTLPGGAADVTFQDGVSVDESCVELRDGTTLGCGGAAVEDHPFSEMRSVCGCNGRSNPVDEWDCSDSGGGSYWSSCTWTALGPTIVDGSFHFVEVFLRMSSVVAGSGRSDGSIRAWVDGELRIDRDDVLMRTGAFPGLAFDQIMLRPFRPQDLSPTETETVWIDDLEVAVGTMP